MNTLSEPMWNALAFLVCNERWQQHLHRSTMPTRTIAGLYRRHLVDMYDNQSEAWILPDGLSTFISDLEVIQVQYCLPDRYPKVWYIMRDLEPELAAQRLTLSAQRDRVRAEAHEQHLCEDVITRLHFLRKF